MVKETQNTIYFQNDQTSVLESGYRLHYWDNGLVDAVTILLVHGQGESYEYWSRIINKSVMQQYRVIAIDLLGYGKSDRPRRFDYSMEQHANTIKEFLEIKGISNIVYVGHSMGGAIGMALLDAQPEVFQSIVLVDTALSPQYLLSGQFLRVSQWQFNLLYPIFLLKAKTIVRNNFFENPDDETTAMSLTIMKQAAPYAVLRSIKEINAFLAKRDRIMEFKKLTIPHYFIYGSKDARVSNMINEYFSGELYVFAINDVKHCPMVEDPSGFCSVLDQILSNQNRVKLSACNS